MYSIVALSHQDSNLDKENQNLSCCRYTMGQDAYLVLTSHQTRDLFMALRA